jgi:CheY-like chemotaxis protein
VECIVASLIAEDKTRKNFPKLANRGQVMRLPISEKNSRSATDIQAVARSLHILVVEDSADANLVLCEALGYLGHSVQGVTSGEEALQLLASHPFDILLTDIRLPGMPGTELAKQARMSNPMIKIIFSSGYGDVQPAGLDAYSLPKPYDLDQVKEVLAHLKI